MARDFNLKLENGEVEWKDAKKFFNSIHQPLFDSADDVYTLFLIPPPELHLFIGIGGHSKTT